MNKKQLRYSFNCVLDAAEKLRCEDLHHKNKDYHPLSNVGPVEYRLNRQIHVVREYAKEQFKD